MDQPEKNKIIHATILIGFLADITKGIMHGRNPELILQDFRNASDWFRELENDFRSEIEDYNKNMETLNEKQ